MGPDRARILSLPGMPAAIYAVGDVHGCLDLFRDLEEQICSDGEEFPGKKLIVLLGDIVDRGPSTAAMIDHLLVPPPDGFDRLVLRGNHEDMFTRFLRDPAGNMAWLDFGGLETLRSYGIATEQDALRRSSTDHVRALVDAHVPQTHMTFLNELAYGLWVGDVFLCHAGIDPEKPLTAQTPEDLIWGNPERIDTVPQNTLIVHGHVALDEPLLSPRRINVDTGAYATGRLTAVRLGDCDQPRLLTAAPH